MNWDQIFSISRCKEVSLCFPLWMWPWWNCTEMRGMNSEKKVTERHREGDLDIKWVLSFSTGPEVMEMGVCRYGAPRAPRLRYHSSYYPACTCQGIDNHPVFYQTAPAAPVSLRDGWLLIANSNATQTTHKKKPFPHFFHWKYLIFIHWLKGRW